MAKTVIAGAGVFGTALAQRLAQNAENDVTLHTIIPEIAKEINAEHTNLHYVPAKRLNERIRATTDDAIF
ncbi:MAG TPA: glycerol-3-phosphate dehydrogenase, partial [Sutterella sp.]|nr:glycerol-3-phosphate dehydrogenase [Sutterella sp.]